MALTTHFEEVFDQLMERAVSDYEKTEEYRLWKEKIDAMEEDCKGMLLEPECDFAYECFALLLETDAREEAYLYRRGFTDCVGLLKRMGVLA